MLVEVDLIPVCGHLGEIGPIHSDRIGLLWTLSQEERFGSGFADRHPLLWYGDISIVATLIASCLQRPGCRSM